MSALRVTAAGLMDIDGEERSAVVIEGARDAIREGCKHCGDEVVIVNAALHRDMLKRFQALMRHMPDYPDTVWTDAQEVIARATGADT